MVKLTIQPTMATNDMNTAKKSKTAELDSPMGVSVKLVEIFRAVLIITVCLK